MDARAYCGTLADRAVVASRELMTASGAARTDALRGIAARLLDHKAEIQSANQLDLDAGRQAELSGAMLDRLSLDDKRIQKMAESVDQIALQTDPVGQVIEGSVRPNGVRLQRVRVSIGVIL